MQTQSQNSRLHQSSKDLLDAGNLLLGLSTPRGSSLSSGTTALSTSRTSISSSTPRQFDMVLEYLSNLNSPEDGDTDDDESRKRSKVDIEHCEVSKKLEFNYPMSPTKESEHINAMISSIPTPSKSKYLTQKHLRSPYKKRDEKNGAKSPHKYVKKSNQIQMPHLFPQIQREPPAPVNAPPNHLVITEICMDPAILLKYGEIYYIPPDGSRPVRIKCAPMASFDASYASSDAGMSPVSCADSMTTSASANTLTSSGPL